MTVYLFRRQLRQYNFRRKLGSVSRVPVATAPVQTRHERSLRYQILVQNDHCPGKTSSSGFSERYYRFDRAFFADSKNLNELISRIGASSFSVYEKIGVIKTEGVEIRDVRSTLVPIRKELQETIDLESYVFVPFQLDEVRNNDVRVSCRIHRLILRSILSPLVGPSITLYRSCWRTPANHSTLQK